MDVGPDCPYREVPSCQAPKRTVCPVDKRSRVNAPHGCGAGLPLQGSTLTPSPKTDRTSSGRPQPFERPGGCYKGCMRSRLRLEVEPAEAGKQLLTTENTDPHGKSTLMLLINFGHRPLVRIEQRCSIPQSHTLPANPRYVQFKFLFRGARTPAKKTDRFFNTVRLIPVREQSRT